MMLDVHVVTHNPQRPLFDEVIGALARQTLDATQFRVTIVDNASHPALGEGDFLELRRRGVDCRILQEPRLGTVHGRLTAIRASTAKALVLVDDDNILQPNYLEVAARLLEDHPGVGCFGGKILLPPGCRVPVWVGNLTEGLHLRDCGESPIVDWIGDGWEGWFPAISAGMVIRTVVARRYLTDYGGVAALDGLGRKGSIPYSHDDWLLAKCTQACDLRASYQPDLVLIHRFDPKRWAYGYFLKRWFCLGRSRVRVARIIEEPDPPITFKDCLAVRLPMREPRLGSLRARACVVVYRLGALFERLC